jgi:hypothetical protein
MGRKLQGDNEKLLTEKYNCVIICHNNGGNMSIYTKLLAAQKEVGALKKGATNPFYNSKYIEINGVLEALLPVLQNHGLLLLQPLTNIEGSPAISTQIIDAETGDKIEHITPITELNDAQKMGASVTYWRRYAVISAFSLGAEDDDGNSLVKAPKKSGAKKTPVKAVRQSF